MLTIHLGEMENVEYRPSWFKYNYKPPNSDELCIDTGNCNSLSRKNINGVGMKGKHKVVVENENIKYEFEIRRKTAKNEQAVIQTLDKWSSGRCPGTVMKKVIGIVTV